MSFLLDDVIAALASPPGPGGGGIVRVSGSAVRDVVGRCFRPRDRDAWRNARAPRRHAGELELIGSGALLPVAIYLWPGSRSYTGQPAAEVHTVGSPPLLEALLESLFAAGARPARAGEFTLRAFLAGRIDLVQAEAVLGVIEAHEQRALETALRQLAGGISGRLGAVRGDLLDLLADLEAGLDFVEEDIEFIGRDDLVARISAAHAVVRGLLAQAGERMQSSGRRRVVLAGLPNAGKSRLFNALVGREAALVSNVQGTTRDYLSAPLDWNGTALELIDTAGWEAEVDPLLRQAQSFRGEQVGRADLILFCTAADFGAPARAVEARLVADLCAEGRPLLIVGTKTDLRRAELPSAEDARPDPVAVEIHVSAHREEGLDELRSAAASRLAGSTPDRTELLGSTAARCRESLASALASLEAAGAAAASGAGEEFVALEVREALEHLGKIVGAVYTDDVLDRVFSRFCIGK